MKTIGLIGGMSAESSREYYRVINDRVAKRLGGNHNARSVMYTVDFEEIATMQREGKWRELDAAMIDAARKLESIGADCVLICTNTMHKCASAVEEAVSVPLIHIADATAEPIRRDGYTRVGLLGTRFTMEDGFYSARLRENYGIETLIPDEAERGEVHRIIYDELCRGIIRDESRELYRDVIKNLVARGAECIALACTEIMLLVSVADSPVPVYDTMELHAGAAAEFALT